MAVTGEVLAAGGHAGVLHAQHHRLSQLEHGARVAMEGAVADDAGGPVVQVQHRRKTEIDAVRAQLAGQHITGFTRQMAGLLRMGIPAFAECAHRRQAGETFAKTLHPSAFVVDADQQRRGFERMDFRRQRIELCRAGVVARKQDDAADQRMAQSPPVVIGEFGSRNIAHQRAECHGRAFPLSIVITTP